MGKKQHAGKTSDPGKAADFRVNPFAGLKADALVLPPEAPAPVSPAAAKTAVPPPRSKLTAADRELLRVFGGAVPRAPEPGAQTGAAPAPGPLAGRVRLQVQRKGKGGKIVTRVYGLSGMDMAAQMEFVRSLCQALGTGAHFDEGILELHGDLRERAADWFRRRLYRVD